MRGKGYRRMVARSFNRITPVCAGKRPCPVRHDTRTKDHPRVCREKVVYSVCKEIAPGSPPRARGKGHLTLAVSHMHRINPAYAGKSRVATSATGTGTGSPPRMRGKALCGRGRDRRSRITPAYAGKRPCTTMATTQPKDHPRVCGEKTKKIP